MPLNLRTAVPCAGGCGRMTNSRMSPPHCRNCQIRGVNRDKKGPAKARRVVGRLAEWTPDWVAHLDRLGERAMREEPLFDES